MVPLKPNELRRAVPRPRFPASNCPVRATASTGTQNAERLDDTIDDRWAFNLRAALFLLRPKNTSDRQPQRTHAATRSRRRSQPAADPSLTLRDRPPPPPPPGDPCLPLEKRIVQQQRRPPAASRRLSRCAQSMAPTLGPQHPPAPIVTLSAWRSRAPCVKSEKSSVSVSLLAQTASLDWIPERRPRAVRFQALSVPPPAGGALHSLDQPPLRRPVRRREARARSVLLHRRPEYKRLHR